MPPQLINVLQEVYYASLAQTAEHPPLKRRVVGSNPTGGDKSYIKSNWYRIKLLNMVC